MQLFSDSNNTEARPRHDIPAVTALERLLIHGCLFCGSFLLSVRRYVEYSGAKKIFDKVPHKLSNLSPKRK